MVGEFGWNFERKMKIAEGNEEKENNLKILGRIMSECGEGMKTKEG